MTIREQSIKDLEERLTKAFAKSMSNKEYRKTHCMGLSEN